MALGSKSISRRTSNKRFPSATKITSSFGVNVCNVLCPHMCLRLKEEVIFVAEGAIFPFIFSVDFAVTLWAGQCFHAFLM